MSMKRQRRAGHLIAQIHQVSNRIFNRLLKEHGIDEINGAQGRILFVLWRRDRLPIKELARETSLGKSTLTSMLDRLEESGHLRRVRSREDRRILLIERTAKDREMESLYIEVSEKMNQIFFSDMKETEIDSFEDQLGRILANLAENENSQS